MFDQNTLKPFNVYNVKKIISIIVHCVTLTSWKSIGFILFSCEIFAKFYEDLHNSLVSMVLICIHADT